MISDQKRILFFVHDGSGLGHLRRVARIASYLQGPCACLVVTGLRQAFWIVSESCEVLHLPNWYGFSDTKSSYWGRSAWLKIPKYDAKQMRNGILYSAIAHFDPDVIMVDYLPFGKYNELEELLRRSRSKKYLILRGLIDSSDREMFCGEASKKIAGAYDEILVTADERIVDVTKEYFEDTDLAEKIRYVGYVTAAETDRLEGRRLMGLSEGKPWVVCSGGGGMNAECVLSQCIGLAEEFPFVEFDIVFGPLASPLKAVSQGAIPRNCRIHLQQQNLPEMHSSCDIVISSGGYNSVLEAAIGGARIIVYSCKNSMDDEPVENATRMSKFYPIKFIENQGQLAETLAQTIREFHTSARPRFEMDTNGPETIRQLLIQ